MAPRSDDSESPMIIRKWHKPSHTVTLACTVASVEGRAPLVAFGGIIDGEWQMLLNKHGMHQRARNNLFKVSEIVPLAEDINRNTSIKSSFDDVADIELHVHLIQEEASLSVE
ncbi:unnamed protein product [Cylicocyclus nassatus]|uniref:Uncharacterized protein n=1 Tax=Cylicocyclus nassatus TaxID=53992 RepID=A0AA36M172_CYLNA|nr:unnamed protein product [Cylicocyclus nassatus]